MRGLTSTLALGVILIGLVGYIYFVDSKKPASGTPEAKAKAFAVEADQIEELRIAPASGDPSRVEKTGGTWRLVEPERADADQGQVSNAATTLASLEITRVVDEHPSDLAAFGLRPAKVDVAFRVKGQKDFRHLLLGEKTAAGEDLYAKTADGARVFLVASYLDGALNRTPFDLRDKTVLKFDHDKVTGVEIAQQGETTQLAKNGTEWSLVKPFAARADFAAVEALLTALGAAQMQKIVTSDPAAAKGLGLEPPDATVTVVAGSARAQLAMGRTEAESTYARDLSRPIVFTLPQSSAADLRKGADGFRRRDLFDARSFNATHVEVRRGGETLTFDRSKDKNGKDVWKNGTGSAVDATKMEDMLTKLSSIRALLFQDRVDPALKMPTLVASLKMDTGKTETVTFARQGNAVLGSRPDEPGSATVEVPAFNETMTAIDALK